MDVYDLKHELEKAEGPVGRWPVVVDLVDGDPPRKIHDFFWDDEAKVFVLVLD